jgi:site-specific DNA-cytosine methylase
MFTPDELKQIQGFPSDYIVCGTKKEKIVQIVITFSYLVISLINSSFQILLERKKITPFSITP